MTTQPTDRKALLTTDEQSNKESKQSKPKCNKLCKLTIIITLISIIILSILLIVIFDVFNLFKDESKETDIAGLIGLWPVWGGNIQNQQIPPYKSILNKENIKNISTLCIYKSINGIGTAGYPTIDNDYNAYFNDGSGYIRSVNLNTCIENWNNSIAELLGYNKSMHIASHQSLTIYQDSNGSKGLLFSTPSNRAFNRFGSTYPDNYGCYAISVHLNNGSLWWKVVLGADNTKHNFRCSSHGFIIDGKYAYGGMAQSGGYNLENGAKFIGRYIKIDINEHKIVNVWYPFNYNYTNNLDENNRSYNGISSYGFGSIIDNYLIFGTGNGFRAPTNIDQCLSLPNNATNFNEYLSLDDSNYIDICGNNQSHNKYFRCLQKNIYPSSFIILNKNTFKLESGKVLQGADFFYNGNCKNNANYSRFCPSNPNSGFNSDIVAVSSYKYNNKLYGIGSSKSNRLHIFEIPSGKTILSRKYGPATTTAHFNMAVDQKSMIGITAINAHSSFGQFPRYKLVNNMFICRTGSIQAFNLLNGNIIWQIVNPYGNINNSYCYNDTVWDEFIDYPQQENTNCDYNINKSNDNINVIIPPRIYAPLNIDSRLTFGAPVTIINNMVIIPSDSGDIWIHDLFNGTFLHHMVCPNNTQFNRPGIKGGVTVVNDRLIYYCGAYEAPANAVNGNMLISMRLNL